MACSICGSIVAAASANTGRDEYFRDPITRMRRYQLACKDDDFWECPECESVFVWHDDRSLTGSGNNDEETLTRLDREESATIRTLAHGAKDLRDAELAALGEAVAQTSPVIGDLVIALLERERTVAQRLVPHLLDQANEHPWALELLQRLASTPDEAARVRLALEGREGNHLDPLRGHVRVVACSICRMISTYPPCAPSQVPRLAEMEQLGTVHHDVRKCPECGSLFEVGASGAMRVAHGLAQALAECLQATTVSAAALQTVKNCGSQWTWVLEHVERRGT